MRKFFEKFASIFIVNRELAVLTVAGLILFGLFGFALTPKQYNPKITAPAFRISVQYPQATAEEVYQTVTRPLEDTLRQISEVDDIFSRSLPGLNVTTVTFRIGSDKKAAKTELVSRLDSNMDLRPPGVSAPPLVEELDPDDVAVVTLALYSQELSEVSLRSLAYDLADKFKDVPGSSKVEIRGGNVRELRITPDVDKLRGYGLDLNSLSEIVAANNVHLAMADLEGKERDVTVEIYGDLNEVERVKNLQIAPGVKLRDVAAVETVARKRSHFAGFSTREGDFAAVFVGIAKHPEANSTVVAEKILEKFEHLRENGEIPVEVKTAVVRNDGQVAAEEIFGLTKNLIISVSIVTLTLLVFLGGRSALIVAVAIPLSLLTVFGVGFLFGQTINRITLFALILSLGLLVDNATVVVENIVRRLREKKSYENSDEVIVRSVAEVSGGLLMSTATTILAFVPMAFVTGMMGPYMGPIPFFVPAALIASFFIAVTVNPFLASWLLGKQSASSLVSEPSRFKQAVDGFVSKVKNKYEVFLRKLFIHRRFRRGLLLTVSIALLGSFVLPATGLVPFRMLPKADRNQFFVYLDMPRDTALSENIRISEKITDEIMSVKHVKSVQSYIGLPPVVDFNGLFKGAGERSGKNLATLKVNLVDKNERGEQSEEVAEAVRERLVKFRHLAEITVVEDPPGPPVSATFQVKVSGLDYDDYPRLRRILDDVRDLAADIPGVEDVALSSDYRVTRLAYRVDSEKVSAVGLTTREVLEAFQTALEGKTVGILRDKINDTRHAKQAEEIVVRLSENFGREIADLSKIDLKTPSGSLVSLSEFLVPFDEANRYDDVLTKENRRPTMYLNAEMVDRSVVYASIDMLKKLLEYRLPDGRGEVVSWNLFGVEYRDENGRSYRIDLGGEWELTLEVFRDMGAAFAVAILAVYFVLVAQFRSLRVPLYILSTIPFALIGVLFGFALLNVLKGTYFTATAMIGVIALAGIVVNNAIIYLEHMRDLREEEDLSLDEALIRAGKNRLLPVALTSLTTVLGSLTIAFDPVWEGLAWAIVFGLSFSAFLTLIILPLIYRKFERGGEG